MRPTAAIVLAAGSGTRFGGAKLIAPFVGRALLQHAIDAACESRALVCALVLGANADEVLERVDSRRCVIVRNRSWQEGIASSIRAGLGIADESTACDACLFLLGDQPFVSSADIDALLCRADLRGRPSIVALRSAKIWGAPVLFPRRDFAALARLRGDEGAKRYAETQQQRMHFVTATDRRAFCDVDTRSDLCALSAPHAR
jgi:molybdenum cofactor cytidylyltransferase